MSFLIVIWTMENDGILQIPHHSDKQIIPANVNGGEYIPGVYLF